MADDRPVYCYGAYLVKFRLTDSNSREEVCERLFYALDRTNPLILGIPFYYDKAVVIDCKAKTYRWKYDKVSMVLEEPLEFMRSAKGEAFVYALIVTSAADGVPTARVRATTYKNLGLPVELSGYKDTFSEEEATKLPSFEYAKYPIDTVSEPPYSPLYNLS